MGCPWQGVLEREGRQNLLCHDWSPLVSRDSYCDAEGPEQRGGCQQLICLLLRRVRVVGERKVGVQECSGVEDLWIQKVHQCQCEIGGNQGRRLRL